jgi:hypothetical protein
VQVSHHPPVACVHAEGPGYTISGEMMLLSSFWGKAITMKNEGGITAKLHDAQEQFSWQKPTFTINNIILGKPWIEAVGETTVQCSNGVCVILGCSRLFRLLFSPVGRATLCLDMSDLGEFSPFETALSTLPHTAHTPPHKQHSSPW